MPTSRYAIVVVMCLSYSSASGQTKQQIVDEQIRYLEHLQKAEQHLQAEKSNAALAELEVALSCNVPDSQIPYLQLKSRGAVAHYLRACAFVMKQQPDAALSSLRQAGVNGFRNTALLKSDTRLASVRELDAFSEVLSKFPDEKLTDPFAGKTVANRKFGTSLQMHRKGNFPKLGEVAPDFELELLGKQQQKLRLSDLRGNKAVVLVFGSFT